MVANTLQYIELQDKVYKRYTKTELAALSGIRANPHDLKERIPFIIVTPESAILYKPDNDGYDTIQGRSHVDYDSEVLEIYSVEEDRIFRQINRKLIEKGYLVEYTNTKPDMVTVNDLSDEVVNEIARAKNPLVLKGKIKEITSKVTLLRIRERLEELEKTKGYLKVVDDRLEVLG